MTRPLRKELTIVSGLPRAGTSLVMGLLQEGGIPLLCDDHRPPDEDNPRGYFEYAAVKRTKEDSSWVTEAEGRAVKVILQLLEALPPQHVYRVLFVHRDVREVVASQERMLRRIGAADSVLPFDRLAEIFAAQETSARKWARRQPNVSVLDVDYNQLLSDPEPILEAIIHFACLEASAEKLAERIEPSLYRNRFKRPGDPVRACGIRDPRSRS